jgi:beta-phosphoglucomutase
MGSITLRDQEFEDLLIDKNHFYKESIAALTQNDLLPGVKDLLDEARQAGIPCAVGSASKNANYILDLIGLQDYFVTVIDGTKVKNPKPDPEVFLNAAQVMNLKPAECIVFEDAVSGIKAAKDGGFFAIGVGNPNIKELADLYLNNLTEFKLNIHA